MAIKKEMANKKKKKSAAIRRKVATNIRSKNSSKKNMETILEGSLLSLNQENILTT